MKKAAIIVLFLLVSIAAYAKRPLSFDRFALDDKKAATVKIIETEYKGRFTVDEWGGYVITVDKNKTVSIYFEDDMISHIAVEVRNCKYSDYLALLHKMIAKYGDPKGGYADEGKYQLYFWPDDPPFDTSIAVSFQEPFTVTESVLYGK